MKKGLNTQRKKRAPAKRTLPEGVYRTEVSSIFADSQSGQLTLNLNVTRYHPPKETEPLDQGERGKFLIVYQPAKLYTCIAAKNIHHAINKATRDCSGKYTSIQDGRSPHRDRVLQALGYKFLPLAKYNLEVSQDVLLGEL